MDNFIKSLNNEEQKALKEGMKSLKREEKRGLDILFKVTTALIDRSINDINFSDLGYVSSLDDKGKLNKVNLAEEKVKLQDGTVISYKEARDNIFKSKITDKEKQANIIEGIFSDLLDDYSSKIIKECNNDYDRCTTISRIINFSKNMSAGTVTEYDKEKDINRTKKEREIIHLEDRINGFQEFGVSPEKFSSLLSNAKEENDFEKIIINMKANAEINRMEINDITEDIKQNEQKYIQQLDSITEDLENVTRSVINNMVEMKDLDLGKIYENNVYLKDLNLVMQKYQKVSEKIEDSKDVNEDFKTKLKQSCNKWNEIIVANGAAKIMEKYFEEPKDEKKIIETVAKVSSVLDSLSSKLGVEEISSNYINTFLNPNVVEFCGEYRNEINNKKTELLGKAKSGIKAILSKGKMNARQREQEKETKRQQNSLTPGGSH